MRPAIVFALAIAVVNGFGRFAYALLLPVMMVLRFVCGVGSAWVFACGGLGIAASGLLCYPVLAHDWAWPAGWLALGVAGALLALMPAKLALTIGGQTSEVSTMPMLWRGYVHIQFIRDCHNPV